MISISDATKELAIILFKKKRRYTYQYIFKDEMWVLKEDKDYWRVDPLSVMTQSPLNSENK